MPHLYELIQHKVTAWREDGYPADDYPAIAEILDYASGATHFRSALHLTNLSVPQF